MAKKKRRKTKAMVRRVVKTARRSSSKAQEVAKKSQALMTPAAGISAAAGAAFGSALGARIVRSGKLTNNQTGALLIAAGTATSYVGYRRESPILLGAGLGTGVSGVSLITTTMYLGNEKKKDVRNAGYLPEHGEYREAPEDREHELLHRR